MMGTEFSYDDAFPANVDAKSTNEFSYEDAYDIKPKRTIANTITDTAVTAAKGVVGAGQAAAGLANLATFGGAGKVLDTVGYDPNATQKSLSDFYSPAQKAANKKVEDAKGFVDTSVAMLQNPSTIYHGAVETAPSMLGGGALAKGVLKGASKFAPKLLDATGKWAGTFAGASGEGAVGAGQQAEQMRQENPDKTLTAKQGALAALSGVGTAAFGVAGGALAKRLGFADIDTFLATGATNEVKKEGFKGLIKKVVGGGISEGAFEEMPQTFQETVLYNAAMDKPLLEGVPEGLAQAAILGGVMGAGANLLPGRNGAEQGQADTVQPTPADTLPTPREDVIAPGVQQPEPPLPDVPPQDIQPQDAFIPPQPAGPISKALGAAQPSTIPTASPQAAPESQQQSPAVAGSRLSETVDQSTGEITRGQNNKYDTSVPIVNSARPYILKNFGEDVVRELSKAKMAGTPISIDQAQKNVADKKRAAEENINTFDLMNDFANSASDVQQGEDAKFRQKKFEQLKGQNESKQATTQSDGSAGVQAVSGPEPSADQRVSAIVPTTDTGGTGDSGLGNGENIVGTGQGAGEKEIVREQMREPVSVGGLAEDRELQLSGEPQSQQLTSEEQETLSRVNRADYWIKPNENNKPYFASLAEKGLIEYDEKTGSYGKVAKAEGAQTENGETLTIPSGQGSAESNKRDSAAVNNPEVSQQQSSNATSTTGATTEGRINDKRSTAVEPEIAPPLVDVPSVQTVTEPSKGVSSKESPPPGTAPSAVESARMGDPSKTFARAISSTIDRGVFKDIVSNSIQNDGQKIIDIAYKDNLSQNDIETLYSIEKKYSKDAGRAQGGGGAGPGKVKQPRRGATSVYFAAISVSEKHPSIVKNNQSAIGPPAENSKALAQASPNNQQTSQKTELNAEQTATTSEQVATPEQLKSITITTEAFGKPQTMTAHEALTAIDDDIAIYDKIRGCLG